MKTNFFRKVLAVSMSVCVMLGGQCAALADEETTAVQESVPVISEDFSSGSVGGYWSAFSGNPGLNIAAENDNQYLKITSTGIKDATAKFSFAGSDAEIKPGDNFTMKYRIRYDEDFTGQSEGFNSRLALGTGLVNGYFTQGWVASGTCGYTVQKSDTTSGNLGYQASLKTNVWHDIYWVADSSNSCAKLYIDGILYTRDVYQRNPKVNPTALFISVDTVVEGKNYGVSIDDIKVYKGAIDPFGAWDTTSIDYSFVSESENTLATVSKKNTDDNVKFDLTGGLFGKASGDKAMYINNIAASAGKDTYLQFDTNGFGELKNTGDSQSLSVNFAFDKTIRDFRLNGYVYYYDGSVRRAGKLANNTNIVTVSANKLTAFGMAYLLKEALQPEAWNNLTLVVSPGATDAESTYSLYLNGTAVAEKASFPSDGSGLIRKHDNSGFVGISNFRGFSSIWLNYPWGDTTLTDANYKKYYEVPGGIYFDDLKLKTHFGHAHDFSSELYSLENGDNSNDKWITGNNIKYFKKGDTLTNAALNLPEGYSVSYYDKNGTAVNDTDMLNDDVYARIITAGGEKRYAKLVCGAKILFSEFGDELTSLPNSNRVTGDAVADAVGVKTTGDKSLRFLKDNTKPGEGYFDYIIQPRNVNAVKNADAFTPVTVSANIYMPANETGGYFRASAWYGAAENDKENLLGLFGLTNGGIYDGGADANGGSGNKIASYKPGEWNRISYTLYPGKSEIEYRVNGVLAATKPITVQRTAVIRFETTYVENPVYLDDIIIVSGCADDEAFPAVAAKEGTKVSNGIITVPLSTDTYKDVLESCIICDADDKYVYSSDLADSLKANDNVESGAILVLTKKNTLGDKEYNTYAYYTLMLDSGITVTQNDAEIENGGKYSSGTITVSAQRTEGIMIIAEYEMNGSQAELVKCATAELSDTVKSADITVSAKSGNYLKVFIWDKFDSLTPCAEPVIITAAQ